MDRLVMGCLGPFQLTRDGRPVPSLGRRARIVLVVLALSADRIVPVERLIAAAWEDHSLPLAPRASLQTLMSRLRTRIGPESILTGPAGYRLVIDPDDVDALRFARMLSDPATADAEQLDQALALWRGEPFTELAAPWLDRYERPQLIERYLTAAEYRADLALAAGDAGSQLPRLEQLAAQYPLREPLLIRLLIALDQAGRSVEALHRYDEVRRELAETLGAAPGPELQDVHARLLSRTSSGPAGGSTFDGPAPRQLPAAVRDFVGRDVVLARLDALVPAEGAVIAGVAGAAGTGKTTLALHWAHRVAGQFPDGQLHVNLHGFDPAGRATDPADAVRGFLDALGVPAGRIPADPEAMSALYRSVLAGKRVLVVLDNARDAQQVRPLLPGSSGCLALVTSRSQLFGLVATEAATVISLDVLTGAEARQLLAVRIGADRVAAEPEAVDSIVASCARLPLALSVVAARAAMQPELPLDALATALGESRLDALTGDEPGIDVRTVFSWSYHTLSAPAARMFRLLGLHPGPSIAPRAAASLAALPLDRTSALLAELARAHLVVADNGGRYSLHDLLRVYAGDLTQDEDRAEDRALAVRRILDWYLQTAVQAATLIGGPPRPPADISPATPGTLPEPLDDSRAAAAWLSAERPAFPEVLDRLATAGRHSEVLALARSVTTFFSRQEYLTDLITTWRAGLAAATQLGDRSEQADAHHWLGNAFAHVDQLDEADRELRLALDLYGAIGDASGAAQVRAQSLTRLFALQKDYAKAVDQAQLAYEHYRDTGRIRGQLAALNDVAWYRALQGRYREALAPIVTVRRLNLERGDRNVQAATTLDTLGYVLHHLGHPRFAIGCYLQAREMQAEHGVRYHQAETLDHLGDAYRAVGDDRAATTAWAEALTILEEIGHPDAATVRAKLPIRE